MLRDPRVDLISLHNLPRYVAIGVDPNDAQRLIPRIERWEDWCRLWSEEAARHEALAKEAADKGRVVTAAEAYVRAAIYYHCGKHLFAGHADEFRAAHDRMVWCMPRPRQSSIRRWSGSRPPTRASRYPDGCASRGATRVRRSRSCCPGSTPARRSSVPGLRRSSPAAWPRSRSTARPGRDRVSSSDYPRMGTGGRRRDRRARKPCRC
jgi:hypothetical protein